jgi:uncharacterized protein YjbJ (UPF0337 family)
MNSDQIKGKVKDVAGGAQKHAGRAAGDGDQAAKGSATQAEGKVQKKMGDVKSGLKKIIRKP